MGNNFSVSATQNAAAYAPYQAFTNNSVHGNCWASANTDTTPSYIWSNYLQVKLSKISVRNRVSGSYAIAYPITGTIYGSNDNKTWTKVTDYNNTVTTAGSWWDIALSSSYYKCYKFYVATHQNSTYTCVQAFNLTGQVKL